MSILLVLGTQLNLSAPLTSLLSSLFFPVQQPITALRQQKDKLVSLIKNIPSLSDENSKLKNENNLLKIKVKTLSELIEDQKITGPSPTAQIQPIRLISFDNLAIFTSSDLTALAPGQPVITNHSLVGLVKEVAPPIIRVIPLNHPDAKLNVQLETGSKGSYLYKNNSPYIVNLGNDTAFNPKGVILTLPTEQIPENLIIGQVEKITTNPADPTQEATIILDKEINTSDHFFIITKPY